MYLICPIKFIFFYKDNNIYIIILKQNLYVKFRIKYKLIS